MYARRCGRVGGGIRIGRRPTGMVVVVVAASAIRIAAAIVVVVSIIIIIVADIVIGAARVTQPGVGTRRKVRITLIGTGIITQIRYIVATVQAMMRFTCMQISTNCMI